MKMKNVFSTASMLGRRAFKTSGYGSSVISRTVSSNIIASSAKFQGNYWRPLLASFVMLGVSSGVVVSAAINEDHAAQCAASKNSDRSAPLDRKEFTNKLKAEVDKIRIKLKRPDGPTIAYKVDNSTHQVSIDAGSRVDSISLLLYWSQVLGSDIDVTTNRTRGITTHALVGGDKKSSMVLSESRGGNSKAILFKEGGFSLNDIDYIAMGYEKSLQYADRDPVDLDADAAAGADLSGSIFRLFPTPGGGFEIDESRPFGSGSARSGGGRTSDPIRELQSLGVEVYQHDESSELGWDHMAGYTDVKEQIEDTIVLPVLHPDVYDDIVHKTRVSFESNRPKAVLLEGPPGTGKTLTARILAQRCSRPLVHLRLEHVVDKFYGESEKKLARILQACDKLEGGAIIFIDEADALAGSRDSRSEMHEASRRLLSVLLQHVEGFKGRTASSSLLLCATNRKQDLDAALLSRFDISVRYELPDADTRRAVLSRYARHLSPASLAALAAASHGLSCRDLKDACQSAERKWASKRVKAAGSGSGSKVKMADVPDESVYAESLRQRLAHSGGNNHELYST